jgi:outer membrane receptor protein involved in Fe transport
MGLGGSYRDESGGTQPDPITVEGDGTGNAADGLDGGFQVGEEFAELSIVPLIEHGFFKWTELSLAARAVEYSSFGFATTWKAGALVRVSGGLALRGTYSTAFRAPAIGELYSGSGESAETAHDPCDHSRVVSATAADECRKEHVSDQFNDTRNQITTVVGGNPELDPETARVITGGLVWEVPQVAGLSLTLDYFRFKIKDAIQAAGATVILENCYNNANHTDCDKVHRRPDGAIDFIDDKITNIGANFTSGLDFAVAYGLKTANAGAFGGQVEGTYLFKYTETSADGTTRSGRGIYDLGLFPTVKAKLVLQWARGHFGAGTNLRYVSSIKECENNDCNLHLGDGHERTVSWSMTGDLFASYELKSSAGRTLVSVGVNNVLDAAPPTIYRPNPDGDASGYDFIGRYFYLRLTQAL